MLRGNLMTSKKESFNYQSLTSELDAIVVKLQDETTSIDLALELYERGIVITKQLSSYLTMAENKLSKIANNPKQS